MKFFEIWWAAKYHRYDIYQGLEYTIAKDACRFTLQQVLKWMEENKFMRNMELEDIIKEELRDE